ncbi:hypothetical protein KP509_31G012200 [Ceratopteris richardii]|nr:hypothetical protein KP509_31G012200 [Ceratopteris richardii]
MLYNGILESGLVFQYLDALVHMFAKCGAPSKAEELLIIYESRTLSTWTAVIDGYSRQGQGLQALRCFEKMQSDGLSLDGVAYACALKACGSVQAVDKGKEIHCEIIRQGLLTNIVLANALLDMYTKCGLLSIARSVLQEIPCRDAASWNLMIVGYIRQKRAREALDCFEEMQSEGIVPDGKILASTLKACGILHAIEKGEDIHQKILADGLLTNDVILGNALVDMYVKCGALEKAQDVLWELPVRDIVTWNTVIVGHVHHGEGAQALHCFEQMQHDGLAPNELTFVCILKACSIIKSIDKGEQIHHGIKRQGLLGNSIMLCNALIDMYGKCNSITKAQKVFEEMSSRDIVSWNSLITVYVQNDEYRKALNCFKRMKQNGFSPDSVTFVCLLKACSNIRALKEGEQIHNEITRRGLFKKNIVLGTALIDMYFKCGASAKAQEILEELSCHDPLAWNTLMSGYLKQGEVAQVVSYFEKMQHMALTPDAVSYSLVLRACGILGLLDKVEQIHEDIEKLQLLEEDVVLCTALVGAYAKCGALAKAQNLAKNLPSQSIASWSALIAGYVQHGNGDQALICFEQMLQEGILPDEVTFACMLKACSITQVIQRGEQIHAVIAVQNWLQDNNMLGNALMDMYAKCGDLVKAVQVFQEVPLLNLVSWNTLITGYVEQGQGEEALEYFEKMQQNGLFPDEVTFLCSLRACAEIGATDRGERIHEMIRKNYTLKNNSILGAALVDMYAKGGALPKAQQVLEELPTRDVVVWSALIAGYAQCGQSKQVLHCLQSMQDEGLYPNLVTFSSLLNACSRFGLVEDAYNYFLDMIIRYGVQPSIEHYSCLVDLLGRTGNLDKAISVIHYLPHYHHGAAWSSFLCACQKWGDVGLGRWAFEQALKADGGDAAVHALMGNIYAAA